MGGRDPGGAHGCPSGTVMSAGPLWTRVFPCGHSGPLRVCQVYDNRNGDEMGSGIHARGERRRGVERGRGGERQSEFEEVNETLLIGPKIYIKLVNEIIS